MTDRGHDPARTQLLRPFVPTWVVDWLDDDPDARWQTIDGSLLFVDISGFTKLSERLARLGRIGAEELTDTLSDRFARMLTVAYRNGGSLVKFGGDALLLLFSGGDHPSRAARSAHGMRRDLREHSVVETAAGRAQLRCSMAVASGPVHAALVGSTHRELLLLGPTVSSAVRLEGLARSGEILLAPTTASELSAHSVGAPREDGFVLRREPAGPPEQAIRLAPPASADVTELLPTGIRTQLLSGVDEAEHRTATVAFIKFTGADDLYLREGADALTDALHELVVSLQQAAEDHLVSFLASDIDENGGKIILAGGVPLATGEDEERVLRTVRSVIERDRRLPIRAGVFRGHLFAGSIGPHYRRTYTVMGDTVNVAARLAAAAEPDSALTTMEVLERSRAEFSVERLEPIHVKGKAEPLEPVAFGPATGRILQAGGDDVPVLAVRGGELQRVRGALDAAFVGRGQIVVIEGPSGFGASQLVRAVTAGVGKHQIIRVRPDRYRATTPYLAFASVVRGLLAGCGGDARALISATAPTHADLYPLLGDVVGEAIADTDQTASLDPQFRPERAADLVAAVVRGAHRGQTLLVVEGIQHLDSASVLLMDRLARSVTERPWLVLATRTGPSEWEPPEDADSTHIPLEPLGREQATAMVQALTDAAPLLPRQVDVIVDRAGGNPLFLAQLVDAVGRGGTVGDLPETVEVAVAAQIDRLSPMARHLLRLAAIAGYAVAAHHLDALLAEEALLDSTARRELAPFFRPDGTGGFRFREPLFRDVAYGALPYRRRKELHERVGLLIERLADEPDDEAELLSMHFSEAKDFDRAWRYSVTAANRARDTHAPVEAAAFYERARRAARRIDVEPTELRSVNEALGDAYDRTSQYEDAAAAYTEARRLCAGTVHEATLMRKHAWVAERHGRTTDAVRWIRRGLRLLEGMEGDEAARERAQLTVNHGAIRQAQGRLREAVDLCVEGAALAREAGESRALAHALFVLDWAYLELGEVEAMGHSHEALRIYRELDDLSGQGSVLKNLGGFAYYDGRWNDAVDLYEESRELRDRTGDAVESALATANRAEILLMQGRLDEAEPPLRRALRTLEASGYRAGAVFVQLLLGRLLGRSERREEALTTLAAAREAALAVGSLRDSYEADLAIAECYLTGGDITRAMTEVEATLARLNRTGEVATILPQADRLKAFALLAAGDVDRAHLALERAAASAVDRGDPIDASVIALAIGRLDDQRDDSHARNLLARLGVTAVALPHAGRLTMVAV